jgi:hypothetical protein
MSLAVIFVAIALLGTVFMSWFLRGLLREADRSIYFWIAPIRGKMKSQLSEVHVEKDSSTKRESSDYYLELLEIESRSESRLYGGGAPGSF